MTSVQAVDAYLRKPDGTKYLIRGAQNHSVHAVAPGVAPEGHTYYNSTLDKQYVSNGVAWVELATKVYVDSNTGVPEVYAQPDAPLVPTNFLWVDTDSVVEGGGGGSGDSIIVGFGSPDQAVGEEGAYYLDSDAHALYGPKGASGASVPFSSVFDTNDVLMVDTADTPGHIGNDIEFNASCEITALRCWYDEDAGASLPLTTVLALWNSVGSMLASVPVSTGQLPVSGSGWVEVAIAPVHVSAGDVFSVTMSFNSTDLIAMGALVFPPPSEMTLAGVRVLQNVWTVPELPLLVPPENLEEFLGNPPTKSYMVDVVAGPLAGGWHPAQLALADPEGNQDAATKKWVLEQDSPRFMGEWDPAVEYLAGSIVTYEGDTWGTESGAAIGVVPAPGEVPPVTIVPIGTDNAADAPSIEIGSTGGIDASSSLFDNTGLTSESGEPSPDSDSSKRSAWLKYSPAESGNVKFTTVGSTGDTVLSLYRYTGSGTFNFTDLTNLDYDDDGSGVGNTSLIPYSVVAGETYYLQIGAYGNNVMSYQFNILNALPTFVSNPWVKLSSSGGGGGGLDEATADTLYLKLDGGGDVVGRVTTSATATDSEASTSFSNTSGHDGDPFGSVMDMTEVTRTYVDGSEDYFGFGGSLSPSYGGITVRRNESDFASVSANLDLEPTRVDLRWQARDTLGDLLATSFVQLTDNENSIFAGALYDSEEDEWANRTSLIWNSVEISLVSVASDPSYILSNLVILPGSISLESPQIEINGEPLRYTRTETSFTTASLAANASESGTVTLAAGYRLYGITTNRPARVRLYGTTAQRDADAARPIGTYPTGDPGLMTEWIGVTGALTHTMSPAVDGFDAKVTPDGVIPYHVTNLDSAAGVVTCSFVYLRTE